MKLFSLISSILVASVFGWIHTVSALSEITSPSPILGDSGSNMDDVFGGFVAWLIKITAVLAVISITWASIQMITAVGDDEKIKKARHTVIYTFVGVAVAGLAYGIVTFISNLNLNNLI